MKKLLATCSNPDCECEEFVTIAHVSQNWLVDKHGDYIEEVCPCVDVTQDPSELNTWTCYECGAEATVKEVASLLCGAEAKVKEVE